MHIRAQFDPGIVDQLEMVAYLEELHDAVKDFGIEATFESIAEEPEEKFGPISITLHGPAGVTKEEQKQRDILMAYVAQTLPIPQNVLFERMMIDISVPERRPLMTTTFLPTAA